ncbi:hypothetical protein [Streptomyces europaeiscabiei]|uniref:hypothetical protein n=1 Tax=Streptomyces europaeiscabiei TaxID=146819 RepID=UPI000A86C9F4|nr:hypothetical protein [Streptomyces europaeiscabiei]
MLHLTPPTLGAREVFQLCTSIKIRRDKSELLARYEEPVARAADRYEQACRTASLHELDIAAFNPPEASQADAVDLIDMYERRMRDKEYPGRPVYDRIRNQRTKCPLCGIGSVRQVDHHLPKSVYPYLAVVPANLLPVCSDCNFLKSDQIPISLVEQTLHPYFDNIEGERWLYAELHVEEPALTANGAAATSWQVRFFVQPSGEEDPRRAARVAHHFMAFELDKLYEEQTADELVTIGYALEDVFNAGGSADVRAYLLDLARFRTNGRPNNWMLALYEALAASDWYCSGGFRPIASG